MKKLFTAAAFILLTLATYGQEKIRYVSMKRNIVFDGAGIPSGYIELSMIFRVRIPESLSQLPNVAQIADTYKDMFNIKKLDTVGNEYYAVFNPPPISINIYREVNGVTTQDLITDEDVKAKLIEEYAVYVARLGQFQTFPFDSIIGKSLIGNQWQDSQ